MGVDPDVTTLDRGAGYRNLTGRCVSSKFICCHGFAVDCVTGGINLMIVSEHDYWIR